MPLGHGIHNCPTQVKPTICRARFPMCVCHQRLRSMTDEPDCRQWKGHWLAPEKAFEMAFVPRQKIHIFLGHPSISAIVPKPYACEDTFGTVNSNLEDASLHCLSTRKAPAYLWQAIVPIMPHGLSRSALAVILRPLAILEGAEGFVYITACDWHI